ncbi:MAG: hypothetical protein ACKOW8_08145 [Flavobacteriales bacterium]
MSILQLKSALKRNEADAIAASWLSNREEIEIFAKQFQNHSAIVQRKGMWILGIIHEKHSDALMPFHNILFSIFSSSDDPAVRREIFQILLAASDEKIRGVMLDEALRCLLNPLSSVAECHHALQWLIEPSLKHAEIAMETLMALTSTMNQRTAAWARYARKQITRIERSLKR